jgi:Domain of unknown function (DU1801)
VPAPPLPREVSRAFDAFPAPIGKRLLQVRALIFATAAAHDEVGRLTETLKWGQPSYLTEETGAGTTVRIDRLKGNDGYAAYFHCQSGLVKQFRELYPDTFKYQGKRAIVFGSGDRVPAKELRHCIALALTHHARKKKP